MNTITRKFEFDAGHRVMNHASKCFFFHGHRYFGEITLEYKSEEEIGYAIDFAEIKRVFCTWVDDLFDHGFIANEKDSGIINICLEQKTKLFVMPGSDLNPTVENIAKVLLSAAQTLLTTENLKVKQILVYETPNCCAVCTDVAVSLVQHPSWQLFLDSVSRYRADKGTLEYDRRKAKQ